MYYSSMMCYSSKDGGRGPMAEAGMAIGRWMMVVEGEVDDDGRMVAVGRWTTVVRCHHRKA